MSSYDPDAADPLDRLQKLAVLRDEGALTPAEFEAQKALVLRRPDAGWQAAPKAREPGDAR